MRRHTAVVLAGFWLACARMSFAGMDASACSTLDQCVSELRQNPGDRGLRDRVIEMTLAASSSTAAPAGSSAERADFLDRFKKLARGEYKESYQCGRLTPLMAMERRERMGCDEAELESGHWRRYGALGTFVFRFPKDGKIEFWNRRGFGFGNVLEMVGTPRSRCQTLTFADKSQSLTPCFDWRSCGRRNSCEIPVWVRLGDDLRTVTVSPDRPPDDSQFDPKARYAYTQYRRE